MIFLFVLQATSYRPQAEESLKREACNRQLF